MHVSDQARFGDRTAAPTSTPAFRHDAMIYESVEQLVAVAAPWLQDGLTAGDAAVISVSPQATGPLRAAVDDERAIVLDRHALYRARTPTAITTFRRLAA